ncbi:MAG TPA: KamA family radical SAM protein [Syntrophales bacterium]|nr:KamA family radical SAM protein [Syntrophales bacterium]HQN24929.1 KamA family radical SAM protein [Syntrophales bacterium]
MVKNILSLDNKELVEKLWAADPEIRRILAGSKHVEEARHILFDHFNQLNRSMFNMKPDTPYAGMNSIEKRNAKECLRVFSNTIRTENEHLTGASPLTLLYDLARNRPGALERVGKAFLCEYLAFFKGITGKAGKQPKIPALLRTADGRSAAQDRSAATVRSRQLDAYSAIMRRYRRRYRTGFDAALIRQRRKLKAKILAHFGAAEADWRDPRWHLKHILTDLDTISRLVRLDDDEAAGLAMAAEKGIPVEITPYYLSLFNASGRTDEDRQIRAQVLPSVRHCASVAANREQGVDMDFMQERSTSPVDGITRRYPKVVILKPFNACPQICVYCQRNWEVKQIDAPAMLPPEALREAVAWIRDNDHISEVLVTGGDPLCLDNRRLEWIVGQLACISHIERIRISTRVPVTLPFRIDDGFLEILRKYHEWGRREICVSTHFEHAVELTPEALEAVKKIKALGVNVYNQHVFTYYNSRRFELCLLRRMLKLSGIDPYYTFNTMGKEETVDFRVPLARIEQERKEEARLLPGVVRTDEPVFNVPRLGKSNLRAWQDHELIMVLPDGRRVYRFYTWEARITTNFDYLYTDVSIYDYLKRLAADGENTSDYKSIWYYF